MRIGLLAAGGWLVAAVLTVGVSWSAIGIVRDAVVTRTDVAAGLPAPSETTAPGPTTPGPTTPGRTATPSRTAASTAPALATGRGGTASARCVGGQPVWVNVTPNQGYSVERNGGQVEFRSEDHRTEMTASCAGTVARIAKEEKDDGSGRGRGGDDD